MATSLSDQLSSKGFVVLQSMLQHAEISGYRERLSGIFASPPAPQYGDSAMVRVTILPRYEWLAELFFSDRVQSSLHELFGEEYVLFPDNSVMDSQYGDWHTDTTSSELAGQTFRQNPDFGVFNVAFYFQANDEHGGGLDVVPGSHLRDDTFLEKVRLKNEAYRLAQAAPAGREKRRHTPIRDLLRPFVPERLLAARRRHLASEALPTKEQSNQPGEFTIAQRSGDLVVFDLRLSHKASWPRDRAPIPAAARKFALFVICGRNNATSRQYRDYLALRAQTEPVYAGMGETAYPEWFVRMAASRKVALL